MSEKECNSPGQSEMSDLDDGLDRDDSAAAMPESEQGDEGISVTAGVDDFSENADEDELSDDVSADEFSETEICSADEDEQDGNVDDDFVLPLNEVVEAILFAANEPLPVEKIARAAGTRIRRDAVQEAIRELQQSYIDTSRAFEIVEIAEKFQMLTRPEFARNIQALYGKKSIKEEKEKKMSPAVLDTLAIIAYKQPVTRAEVEAVRGVGCGQIMRQLMERGSIKPVGKKMDVIGYPLLYGTTDDFLSEFGLASLDVLPMASELRRLTRVELPKPEIVEDGNEDGVDSAAEKNDREEVHSKLEDAVVIAGGESENMELSESAAAPDGEQWPAQQDEDADVADKTDEKE